MKAILKGEGISVGQYQQKHHYPRDDDVQIPKRSDHFHYRA